MAGSLRLQVVSSLVIAMSIVLLFVGLAIWEWVDRNIHAPNEELKRILVQSPERWNEVERPYTDRDLRRLVLRGRVLQGLDLEGVDLRESLFEDVVVRDCNMKRVRLSQTRFRNVTIETSDLSDEAMNHVDWENVTISRSRLAGFRVDYSTWKSVRLDRVDLSTVHGRSAFYSVKMEDVLIEDSDMGTAFFTYTDAQGLTIRRTDLRGAALRKGTKGDRITIVDSRCGPAFAAYCGKGALEHAPGR